jgi:hypothetical protein
MEEPTSGDEFAPQINAMSQVLIAEPMLRTAIEYLTQSPFTLILLKGRNIAEMVQISRILLEVNSVLTVEEKTEPAELLDVLAADVELFNTWRDGDSQDETSYGDIGAVAQNIFTNVSSLVTWFDQKLDHPPNQILPDDDSDPWFG